MLWSFLSEAPPKGSYGFCKLEAWYRSPFFFSNGGEDLRLSCGVSVFTRLRLLEGTSPNPELQPKGPKPYL